MIFYVRGEYLDVNVDMLKILFYNFRIEQSYVYMYMYLYSCLYIYLYSYLYSGCRVVVIIIMEFK